MEETKTCLADLQHHRCRGGATTTATTMAGRDPLDAAQVPPSVMHKHLGEPTVEHDDLEHGRMRRNSRATAQENFRGI